jgi:hypothetical protein
MDMYDKASREAAKFFNKCNLKSFQYRRAGARRWGS